MTDYRATPEHWATVEAYAQQVSSTDDCLLELRSRVEALEGKYETMRLATLEWGKDVENLQRWNDQQLMRIERLEGIKRPASKVYEISEPLELTPEQAQHVRDLLTLNSKPTSNPSQIRSSLVERVAGAICASYAYNKGLNADYDDEPGNWMPEAHAAVREVKAWLQEKGYTALHTGLLEREAGDA